eukprot:4649759-Amphidinium_carterae.1
MSSVHKRCKPPMKSPNISWVQKHSKIPRYVVGPCGETQNPKTQLKSARHGLNSGNGQHHEGDNPLKPLTS